MALPLFLLLASLSGSDTEHLIVVETLLPKGSILDVQNEDKSLISRVSIEVERIGLVKTESGFIVRSVEDWLREMNPGGSCD